MASAADPWDIFGGHDSQAAPPPPPPKVAAPAEKVVVGGSGKVAAGGVVAAGACSTQHGARSDAVPAVLGEDHCERARVLCDVHRALDFLILNAPGTSLC